MRKDLQGDWTNSIEPFNLAEMIPSQTAFKLYKEYSERGKDRDKRYRYEIDSLIW